MYQLSAEDLGCKIRVEVTPVDADAYHGTACGEFGPIALDPAARQTLEYVLGTGGSQFPVTVLQSRGEEEEEAADANLCVNAHVIKVCFAGGAEAIALKYTIDYPRLELHALDTQRFKIFYTEEKVDAKYEFDRCLEIRALSRQSRDLIALAIKCFSAHTYFINSKIIASVRVC